MAAVARTRGLDPSDVEVWFADEARVGQKNKITRRWARAWHPAQRAAGPAHRVHLHLRRDLPGRGQGGRPGAALVQHGGDEPAPGRDLGPGRAGPPRRAGRRPGRMALSERLVVPANITIVPLPAKCPELNPQENVWQFLRDNWLSNRVFTSYDNIVDHCCHAWNRLVEQPWKIMSIGSRDWAQGF